MVDEGEIFHTMVRKQKDCEFSLKFLLEKENDVWNNCFTILKLEKKGKRNERIHNYKHHVLGEKILNLKNGLNTISKAIPVNGEMGKLTIPDYGEFIIKSKGSLEILPSRKKYGLVKSDWPMTLWQSRVQKERIGKRTSHDFLGKDVPYYPDIDEAIISFFDLTTENFSSYGAFYAAAVDYRARIESMKLLFSEAELKIHAPEIDYSDLTVKIFAKAGPRTLLEDIQPKSESVRFKIGFQPETLSVVLLSNADNLRIDRKDLSKWSLDPGVVIERPEEEILALTRAGESQDLEYKYEIHDQNKKDFIESVVAFLNSNRGVILIGVDDDGGIVGSEKNVEAIKNMIHDSCDPPPKGVRVGVKEIEGKKVLIVEIPEGEDKPYQSLKDKNWYVRHSASDMKMERSELFKIIEELIRQKSDERMIG